jgi:hypothetical protein
MTSPTHPMVDHYRQPLRDLLDLHQAGTSMNKKEEGFAF